MDSENKKKKDLNTENAYSIKTSDQKTSDLSNLSILLEKTILEQTKQNKADLEESELSMNNHEVSLDESEGINLDISDFKDPKNLEKLKINSQPAIDNEMPQEDMGEMTNASNVIDFRALKKETKQDLNLEEVEDENLQKLDSIEENASEIKIESEIMNSEKDLKDQSFKENPLEEKIRDLEKKLLEKSEVLEKKQKELELLKEEQVAPAENNSQLVQDLQNQLDIAQHQNKSILKEKDKWILNLKEQVHQKQKDKEHFQRQFEDLNLKFQKKKDLLSRILKAIRLIEKLIEENN